MAIPLALMAVAAGPIGAEGFARNDLMALDVDLSAFTTGAFEALPQSGQLMIACLECARTAVVSLKIEGVPADSAAAFADMALYVEALQAACETAREGGGGGGKVACLEVSPIALGGAAGWTMATQSGQDREIRTYDLILGTEQLTIRAIAETRDEADAIGRTAYEQLAPVIVGAVP